MVHASHVFVVDACLFKQESLHKVEKQVSKTTEDLSMKVFVLDSCEGLSCLDLDFVQILQGVQHVDDACRFSKCLCVHCIHKTIVNLWPTDVGATLEECGQVMRMLGA